MRVAILGCGYVGLELGRRLRPDHVVVGVRRSDAGLEAVAGAGLEPVEADVTDPGSLSAVPDVDAVVFAASAGGRGAEAARRTYVDGLRATVTAFGDREDPPDRLLYTGSTGVYGDRDGEWVDEGVLPQPDTGRGEVLLDAEAVALEDAGKADIEGTVVRFAGLYGPDRYRLGRYLDRPVPPGWVNLLHRDDAAGVLAFLLERDLARREVVLAVDDEPVTRPDLAAWLAAECGVDPPGTRAPETARERADKRCSNAKLRGLGYEFEYPTYREGYRAAIEAYREGSYDGSGD